MGLPVEPGTAGHEPRKHLTSHIHFQTALPKTLGEGSNTDLTLIPPICLLIAIGRSVSAIMGMGNIHCLATPNQRAGRAMVVCRLILEARIWARLFVHVAAEAKQSTQPQ